MSDNEHAFNSGDNDTIYHRHNDIDTNPQGVSHTKTFHDTMNHFVPVANVRTVYDTSTLAPQFQMMTGSPGIPGIDSEPQVVVKPGRLSQQELLEKLLEAQLRSNMLMLWRVVPLLIATLTFVAALFVALVITLIVWRNTGETINNFSVTGMETLGNVNNAFSRTPEWFDSLDGLSATMNNWTGNHAEKWFTAADGVAVSMDAFTEDPVTLYNLVFSTIDMAHASISPLQNQTGIWVKKFDDMVFKSEQIVALVESLLNQADAVGLDTLGQMAREIVSQIFNLVKSFRDFQSFQQKLPSPPPP